MSVEDPDEGPTEEGADRFAPSVRSSLNPEDINTTAFMERERRKMMYRLRRERNGPRLGVVVPFQRWREG
eukprot:1685181-Amphidinium_carterae.1